MNPIVYFIVIMGIFNVFRMLTYLISSDIYSVREALKTKRNSVKRPYLPMVSVIVPAHNEEAVIVNTLKSLHASHYPKNKMEIIVVDDGSTDNTSGAVRKHISELHKFNPKQKIIRQSRTYELSRPIPRTKDTAFHIRLISQSNSGKAEALNNAIKNYAKGKLIMCLDADSSVHQDMVKNSAAYFRDRKVVALASNVNIMENGSVLSLVQRFEYLISYHMKKAQTVLNVEYIIGGIGSMTATL
jgi:biofilm PGA synthesis N-glycosyltransferase PgaC